MTHRIATIVASIVMATGAAYGARMDFNDPALVGTTYGAPAGHSPGDLVHSEEGINMHVVNFMSTITSFNRADVVLPPASLFDPTVNNTPALNVNNIGLRFDFTSLGDVNKVSFHYAELGGTNNFEINTTGKQQVPDFGAVVSPPGFDVKVFPSAVSADMGRVEVTRLGAAPIRTLLLGGQELALDNIHAVPEPASGTLVFLSSLLFLRRRFA